MLEWTNRPVLKTGVLHGTVGSNPTPSAIVPTAVKQRVELRYLPIASTAGVGFEQGVLKGVCPLHGVTGAVRRRRSAASSFKSSLPRAPRKCGWRPGRKSTSEDGRGLFRPPLGPANKVMRDFSRPGKPTDNAYIEAFNARLRAECLNTSWFLPMNDARDRIESWRHDYNTTRPHSALGNLMPRAFARQAREARKIA